MHYAKITQVRNGGGMASFRKMAGNRWRAEVSRQGVRASKVFASKRAATDWAARQEYLILNTAPKADTTLFRDVLERYANEVSPRKRGERWEILRIARFKKDTVAGLAMADLRPHHFADWRDKRLRDVAPGTVNREMVLLSAVLTVARKEWGLLDINPISDVSKPTKPPPRDRLVTDAELERLALCAGTDLTATTARAFHAFLFAIETGMRAGEIIGLTWEHINIDERTARLPMTKNGTARNVPLSSEAVRLLQALPWHDPAFNLRSDTLDVLWRRIRDQALVTGLVFHDSRHTAITRLARKLDVLDLARMVGHRNLSQLLGYYNASAADIAKRLD
jgi:integrase